MKKHIKRFNKELSRSQRKLAATLVIILSFQFCYAIPVHSSESGVRGIEQSAKTITGKVVDANGDPVPGATIQVKGTQNAALSDADGNFSLSQLVGNETIVVTFVGMKADNIKLSGQSEIKFVLTDDAIVLGDVVAFGYSTVKKKDLTGSVVSVNAEAISRIPANDIRTALVGLPGVRIVDNKISIRGNRSIKASNEPLIVLDGMPYNHGLQTINPEDVETIDVLKDASSTALYGSKGANGVVIITTKKGVKGRTDISYNGFVGIGRLYNETYHAMNSDQYIAFKRESYKNAGTWQSPADDGLAFLGHEVANMGKVDSDWIAEIFDKSRVWTSHNISVASGSEKTQYKIALNYRYNDERLDGVYSNNYFVNTELEHQFSSKFKAGASIRLYYNKNKNKPDQLGALLQMSPLTAIRNENGSLNEITGDPMVKNPLLTSNNEYYNDQSENWKTSLRMFGSYDIIDGLSFRTNFAVNQVFYARGLYYDARYPGYHDEARNFAGINNNRQTDWEWNNVLSYKKSFGKHTLDAFAVFEVTNHETTNTGANGKNQYLSSFQWHNMGALTESKTLTSNFTRSQMISYVGRVQYGYDDRYLASVTFRQDGASQLSKGERWDFFPSFSGAWRVTEEAFMKDVKYLDNLKLRASYGTTGNHSVSPYGTLGRLNESYLTFNTPQGEVHYVGMEPGIMPTPHLKWEKTKMLNLGLDFGFLDGRISGTFDYYDSKTTDILNLKLLPYTSGFNQAWDNIGKSRNRGFEVGITAVPIETKDWTWTVNGSYFRNKEEFVQIYDGRITQDIQNKWFVGHPISGIFYDFKQVGIWQEHEKDLAAIYSQKVGEVKVKDMNADGKIDGNDRVILGSNRPKWAGTLSSTLKWKDLDFAMDIYSEFGALAYDGYSTGTWAGQMGRWNTVNVDYWTPEKPNNRRPKPIAGEEIKYLSSTGYHKNDFIEIRNITLGYTLPQTLLKNHLKDVRLYVAINNPYRYWKYKRDGGITFTEKVYLFGANVKF